MKPDTATILDKEQGTIIKKWHGRLPVAIVFPNVYRLGMSNLGMQIVYRLANEFPEIVCERVFLPDDHSPPKSVESGRLLTDFPVVLCALSFEQDYENLIRLFLLAGVELFAAQRNNDSFSAGDPLIVGGGVATFINPEPLADFFDLFLIGDAEVLLPEFLQSLLALKSRERHGFLKSLAHIPGNYVPSLYEYVWEDGQFAGFMSKFQCPSPVQKTVCHGVEKSGHSEILTPETEFSDMFIAELGRGCSRGCRFCAAGFIYRPPRQWKAEAIIKAISERPQSCRKVGLLGMEMTEPKSLAEVSEYLLGESCSLSFSSLRADAITPELVALLRQSRLKTAAIAPDGGSARLRRVINKGLSREDLLSAATLLVGAGVMNLKLYFMVGLPSEGDEDLDELVILVEEIKDAIDVIGRERGRLATIVVSLNSFVPKASTPFQYAGFAGVKSLKLKIQRVRKGLKVLSNVKLHVDKPDNAFYQAVLARGDRSLGPALVELVVTGRNWKQVFKGCGVDVADVVRPREQHEKFCWDIIGHGMSPGYLWQEYQRGLSEKATPLCDTSKCKRCGVCNVS
jgi:radical SAM superfamily enzyme YgiQ (UPF0313 family)